MRLLLAPGGAAATGGAAAAAAAANSGGFIGLMHNGTFIAAFLGFLFAQSAKVFTAYYTERKWDFTRLVSSGGMPSSHTALVSLRAGGWGSRQRRGRGRRWRYSAGGRWDGEVAHLARSTRWH